MKSARVVFGICAFTVWSQPVVAQDVDARVGVFAEQYKFDDPLVYRRVRQYTVPVGITVPFGRTGHVALSSGYTNVRLFPAAGQTFGTQSVSGTIDTELRVGWNAIPGRLMLLATGRIPTGVTAVGEPELMVLGALASDVIGFTAPSIGSGGGVGLGFAGAIPLGGWALGIGATVRESFRYEAVSGAPRLKPGAEARFRIGLEGSVSQRTYVRLAGVLAHRRQDMRGSETVAGIGNRIVGHLSLNQGIANTLLVVYVFDVFRDKPQIEGTPLGTAVLPRGNLFGVGFNWVVPVWRVTVTPKTEFRSSIQAPLRQDADENWILGLPMRLAGQSVRVGIDLRYPMGRRFAIVGQGSWVSGFIVQGDVHADMWGTRASIRAEWRP